VENSSMGISHALMSGDSPLASLSPYAYCGNSPIKNIDPDGREVRDGTGAYCEDNKDLKALAKSLAAHNDPNSIMIVAHGVYDKESDLYAYSIDIQTYNTKSGEWDHNYISNGKQLDKFLSANSKTWKDYKDGKISADDLHIVFYACGSSPVVQEISKDDAFKDVTLIAPNKRVHCLTYVNGRKDTTIENTKFEKTPKGTYRPVGNERDWGEWLTCKNGFIPSSYKGNKNLLPGTKGFAYR
jgi:hypothetical protein